MNNAVVVKVTLSDFLAALYPPESAGPIELRALPSKAQGFFARDDSREIDEFIRAHSAENIYFGVSSRRNPGDGSLANCAALHTLFCDIDFKTTPEAQARLNLDRFPLKPSITVMSGGGLHCYWLLREPLDLSAEADHARSLLRRLALAVGGDLASAEPARVLRVPGRLNFKYEPARRVLIEHFDSERRYNASELGDLLPLEPEGLQTAERFTLPKVIVEGDPGRNTTLYRFGRQLRCAGLTQEEIFEALRAANANRCNPPLHEEEVKQIARHVVTQADRPDFNSSRDGRSEADESLRLNGTPFTTRCERWPTLAQEALHGLAGDIVKTIDPYTEADPTATLAHLLVAFGNMIGPGPHYKVQHDHHPARLNVCLVGQTGSGGRKGLSWSIPRYILSLVDREWAKTRVRSGLSSGEGLIYHVRDSREEAQPVKERGRVVTYESVVVDQGEADKRLLIIEPELAVVLRRMSGEGNTLSAVIREAWDSGHLATLTKNSPLRATSAHVSIVGHITRGELTRYLTETERANGFANRFIWLLVRRSKDRPEGDAPPEALLAPLIDRVIKAREFAESVGQLQRDADARDIWAGVYGELVKDKSGLLGAILSRADAQVLRLSVVYALLDCSAVICPPHLKAALAVWDYSEQSARLIFGDATGNPTADRILRGLRTSGEMSETAIRDLFHRNVSGNVIDAALVLLEKNELATREMRPTAGRSVTVWRATT